MNDFFKFMSTRWGRATRFCLGMIMLGFGLGTMGFWGLLVAFFGLVAMFTGATDLCILAAFWNLPITGRQLRKHFGIHERKLDLEA